jgi:hypothetical protein
MQSGSADGDEQGLRGLPAGIEVGQATLNEVRAGQVLGYSKPRLSWDLS